MKELKSIFPPKTKVMFGESVVEIKSITLKDLPVVAEIAENVFDKVMSLLFSGKEDQELGIAVTKEIIHILQHDLELLQKLIEITTSVEKEIIPDLSLEAGLFLLDSILEVNKDFLFQNVLPRAKELFSKYAQKESKTNG